MSEPVTMDNLKEVLKEINDSLPKEL